MNKLDEIKKALEKIAHATHADCACFSDAQNALDLLTEIQEQQAVDLDDLYKELCLHVRPEDGRLLTPSEVMGAGVGLRFALKYLASKNLLRVNTAGKDGELGPDIFDNLMKPMVYDTSSFRDGWDAAIKAMKKAIQ